MGSIVARPLVDGAGCPGHTRGYASVRRSGPMGPLTSYDAIPARDAPGPDVTWAEVWLRGVHAS
jgi:hypothetical protein